MASEKLLFEISALYSASPEMSKALDDMAKINTTAAKVRSRLNAMNNVSGKTGEQFRKARVNTAQLGIQFNQLGTQIASGTNIGMAFTQQIGDIGFAMSNASGKLGAFGRMLSGPVGFALGGLMMAFGPAIGKMLGFGDAAEDAEDAVYSLSESYDTASMTTEQLTEMNDQLAESLRGVKRTAIEAARAQLSVAGAAIMVDSGQVRDIQDEIDRLNELITDPAFAEGASSYARQIEALTAQQQRLNTSIENQTQSQREATIELDRLTYGMTALEGQVQSTREAMNDAEQEFLDTGAPEARAEFTRLQGVLADLEKQQKSTSRSTREQRSELEELRDALKLVADPVETLTKRMTDLRNALAVGNIEADEYARTMREALDVPSDSLEAAVTRVQLLRQEMNLGRLSAEEFFNAITGQTTSEAKAAEHESVTAGIQGRLDAIAARNAGLARLSQDIAQAVASYSNDLLKTATEQMRGYTDEMKQSFENVGMSVSDAFQGMLTGAMSWKDGMSSIIKSVVAELWKLYVVQQIVGFVTDTLGSIGLPIPKGKASGGYVQQGTPYMVGERGPEMFIPGGSGTIIPNKNMGGGGANVVVNVDARGASDPAMVREQAQRAVLEAAPAIVAAAEKRTVNRLQRPRLGGAIQ